MFLLVVGAGEKIKEPWGFEEQEDILDNRTQGWVFRISENRIFIFIFYLFQMLDRQFSMMEK